MTRGTFRAETWGNRRGRLWTADDVAVAKFLRHCGMDDEAIGKLLDRTPGAVIGKIGYAPRERRYYVRAA
jgi:hypothetical protein